MTDDLRARLIEWDVEFVLEAQFNRDPSHMADARMDWDSVAACTTAAVQWGMVDLPWHADTGVLSDAI